jgi:hypothetical protein
VEGRVSLYFVGAFLRSGGRKLGVVLVVVGVVQRTAMKEGAVYFMCS